MRYPPSGVDITADTRNFWLKARASARASMRAASRGSAARMPEAPTAAGFTPRNRHAQANLLITFSPNVILLSEGSRITSNRYAWVLVGIYSFIRPFMYIFCFIFALVDWHCTLSGENIQPQYLFSLATPTSQVYVSSPLFLRPVTSSPPSTCWSCPPLGGSIQYLVFGANFRFLGTAMSRKPLVAGNAHPLGVSVQWLELVTSRFRWQCSPMCASVQSLYNRDGRNRGTVPLTCGNY